MISDGLQTLARKGGDTNGYTTTVPFHPSGIDWNCNGAIESEVSEDINNGPGRAFESRDDWVLIPQGRRCLLGSTERINAIGYPSDYVDDTYGPPCPSTAAAADGQDPFSTLRSPQQDEPEDPVQETDPEEAILDGLPSFESCDGLDNDGDEEVDEGCPDADADGLSDDVDNCPLVANADQRDANADFRGDACDGRPGAPTGLEAEATGGDVILSWEPPAASQPSGYSVYRQGAGEASFRHVGSYPTTDSTSYTDAWVAGLAGDVSYRVRALNRYGEEGDVSATVRVTLKGRVYLPLVTRAP
jgi:hypothetical protein